MSPQPLEQIEAAIAALQAQRAILGDAVVETALTPLREQLAGALAPAQEPRRRQVSVLFADIVGSTALVRELDPEDTQTLFDDALRRFTSLVSTHRGRVLQYAGDSLLAVFGADESHEDDPELAVRAGLALLAEARRVGVSHGRVDFAIRVGIHTGPVLLGGGLEGESGIRGVTVHVAARMEQTASAGDLRISHHTYAHVRGLFELEPQPPLAIKGVDEPMRTWLVRRSLPPAFRDARRGIDRLATRFVGRDDELQRLLDALDVAERGQRWITVTLCGDPGLGKSRLLAEFEDRLERRAATSLQKLRGRAHPQGLVQPYGLMRDMFWSAFAIRDSDTHEEVRARLEAGLGPTFGERSAEPVALIGQLFGLDFADAAAIAGIGVDARQLRDRAFHAAAQFVLGRAVGGVLVVLVDDLHWADAGSLDFLDHLARSGRDHAIFLLCASRPELRDRRTAWGEEHPEHRWIDLDVLTGDRSVRLVEALLTRIDEPPPMLAALLAEVAEGNPFFMEELLRMLIDDGAINVDGERWRVDAERLFVTRVPGTLVEVLQARLDALAPAERRAQQQASVIGFKFWDKALRHLQYNAADALGGLEQRGLIVRQAASAFEGCVEYAFKHHLLKEVTYDSVLKRWRRELHRAVAVWIRERSGTRIAEFGPLIAGHLELAGDTVAAADAWQRAATDAMHCYAYVTAVAHAEKALALDDGSRPAWRFELMRAVETALASGRTRDAVQRERHAAWLDELDRLAEGLGDDARRSLVRHCRAFQLLNAGELESAHAVAEEALALAGTDPALGARARDVLASVLMRMGRHGAALVQARAGLPLARASGQRGTEANLLTDLGQLLAETGEPIAAATMFEDALALHRKDGNPYGEITALGNVADVKRQLGDFESAQAQMLEAARLARELGYRRAEGMSQMNLALVCLNLGDAAGALAHAEQARSILRDVGLRWSESAAATNAGLALLALGRLDEAAGDFEAAVELADRHRLANLALPALSGLAAVALARGDVVKALALVRKIEERLAEGASLDGLDEPLRLRWTCYRVLAATADEQARTELARAHAELMAMADRLSDAEDRRRLLQDVPVHREIVRARDSDTIADSAHRAPPASG